MTRHWAPGTAYGLGDQVLFAWQDEPQTVTQTVVGPRGWEDVGYVNDTDSTSALHRYQKPRNDRRAALERHYRPGWEQVMRLAASAANDPKIEWRDPKRRDLDAYRRLIDEDLAYLADISNVPRYFMRPLDPAEQRLLASRELVTATVGGENPGDGIFTPAYHPINRSIDINLPRKKKKIMTAALSNGGHLSVGITLAADTDDGNLTAYETLLLAARHVGASEGETITLDSSGDPTIELQDHEVDLHALADLIQPQAPSVKTPPADEEPPAEKLKPADITDVRYGYALYQPFEGRPIYCPAVQDTDGSVTYCHATRGWTATTGDSSIAATFTTNQPKGI